MGAQGSLSIQCHDKCVRRSKPGALSLSLCAEQRADLGGSALGPTLLEVLDPGLGGEIPQKIVSINKYD